MPTTDAGVRRAGSRSESGGVVRGLLVMVAVLATIAVAGFAVLRGIGPLPDPDGCTAEVGGHRVDLSTEQAEHATLIAAIGVQRGLPARGVSIALATAYQESKIRNLDYGDRDSVGIFQQRPSQGWGSEGQLQRPTYAINAFYDALEKIDGYESMRITEAAQLVQRSGFPEAYEDHADDARALASALTGYSPGGQFSCVARTSSGLGEQQPNGRGLTPRAAAVARSLERGYGDLSLGGFAPEGVDSGHMEGSAHYDGRAVDVFVRPVNQANNRLGWSIAAYLVANADRLEIAHVIFDDAIWSAGVRSEAGWRDYDPGDGPGDRQILEHRDHVHVDVA